MIKRKLGYIDTSIMCLVGFDNDIIRPVSREELNEIYQGEYVDEEPEGYESPEKPDNEYFEIHGICPECFEKVEGVETETGTKFNCHYCDYEWLQKFDLE